MTPHEKDLIENMEANGFPEAAERLRKFLDAQNRDANADPENLAARQAAYRANKRDWKGGNGSSSWEARKQAEADAGNTPLSQVPPEKRSWNYHEQGIGVNEEAGEALFSERKRNGTLKKMTMEAFREFGEEAKTQTFTPEQARYAYDNVLSEPRWVDDPRWKAPMQAIPCDLSHARAKTDATLAELQFVTQNMAQRLYGPKHRFITLSGETRTEPACR